ncbi:hypothetical protein PACTADRAFT_3426 [Pachysolen tannophilus NRRL Y-2460]|uniref:Sodium/hydrogen exchanger n=1 Tax=Pachysolen tannophilus NRRL Y-2460 TaxID=669874 RepID=A0A1E4TS19_PACTA|nr:hypothetical protein PACTADRAFT_3426 [Pachysolen tannophilus NRRL Y-2460]
MSASEFVYQALKLLLKRANADYDDGTDEPTISNPTDDGDLEESNPVAEEIFSSWALFILLFLLCSALWSSFYLQQRRIKSIHETVLSIFYGMVVGLIIRVSPGHYIQNAVKFNSGYFFNILLPPIILNSGYELHQANFFRNIGSILTFAIPGTFISAIVLGIILYIWTKLGLESINIQFVDALAVGATLSATDPVTILSIFNAYKVDPKLYTIIFGESLLNDAISIVMFETCQKFHGKDPQFSSLIEGIGIFLVTFTISLVIGLIAGLLIALILKHSHIRRYPQIESCLVLLFAYESYFFSNGCHMSGIVSLLFCGITLKHYAYFNMSRRTQIATKYIFQLLAQLSENFIFIYLGLSLFTEVELVFKPLLIIITTISICIARYCSVFPLSRALNWVMRKRQMARDSGSVQDEMPYNYQMMTFWAGLRGAVGVALAMGLQGEFKSTLLATVLVVVVLTVILFGGTTAGMLEILNIKTGCVDEVESDDEFDIEAGITSDNDAQRATKIDNNIPMYSTYSDQVYRSRTSSQTNLDGDNVYSDDAMDVASVSNSPANSELITNDLGDIPPLAQTAMVNSSFNNPQSINNSNNSINNNNKSASSNNLMNLTNILDDHAKWFMDFDENIIKPFVLDSNQKRNGT